MKLFVPRLLAAVLVFASSDAIADAVPPAPLDCPNGARGETSHNGQWCSPSTCKNDSECSPNAFFGIPKGHTKCAPYALCVRTETLKSESGWSMGTPVERETAEGPCGPNGACKPGATCQTAQRCVDPSHDPAKPEPTRKPKSCGCTVPGGDDSPGISWLFLPVVFCAASLRRRWRAC